MFGKDHGSFGPPSSNDETYRATTDLLGLAREAFSRNDYAQAAHLYLAAFDASEQAGSGAYQPAIDGLRQAWHAACELKDRALAEHVFEKLEPFSNSEEVAMHAEALQRLALDKLEEFGFSREDLQDMADMVSEDFASSFAEPPSPESVVAQVLSIDTAEQKATTKGVLSWPLFKPGKPESTTEAEPAEPKNPEDYTYADLVGFGQAIATMNKRGIGLRNDEQFEEFMAALAQRHGINSLPSFETLLFRSPSRADMNQFMMATAQELAVPSVRMYMEETPMGFPVLCIMTTSDFKMNPARGGFVGPGILMLEDIDTWGTPFSSMEENEGMPYYAQFSRGARDAVMFIRSAVENSEVQVMATCSSDAELDEFFYELLGPIDVFEIDLPNEDERRQVWEDVYALYPSMRVLQNNDIVRLSANLSRFDIYMAAREAVDQAFKSSIAQRSYIPVTLDNLYNKLAAYQPLDSSEYHELEEQAVASLRQDLDRADDLLKGTE